MYIRTSAVAWVVRSNDRAFSIMLLNLMNWMR